ncbi:MAG: efflux RND transporter periplasmic adaptor subunit [Chthoniobacteraceae bacterium]
MLRIAITLSMVVLAALASWFMWDYYMEQPWTRDGRVCADVVRIAPDVSGLVSEVLVRDDQTVRKGDVLFRVDRARFELALQQCEANVASADAAMQLARRNADRYQKLQGQGVSELKIDEVTTTAAQNEASWRHALVERDVAKLNLERSEIKAPVNGTLTNFSLREGNYVTAGQAVTALVDGDSFYVAGYFEETKLRHVCVGAAVKVRLMGGAVPLAGRVVSIASGIEDRERSDSTRLLANVNPTFSWVRLAQRVPVRVMLDEVPQAVHLVAGQTATVIVR